MGYFAPYPNPFDQLLLDLEREVLSLIQSAQHTIGDATDWIAQAALTAIDWLLERYNEFVAWVREVLMGFGNPTDLDTARDLWNGSIRDAGLLGSEQINAEALATDNEWEGRGADAYNDRVPTQSTRLHDFGAIAERVSEVLSDLAGAMSTAISANVVALGVLIATALAAVPQIAALIGIPTGLGTVVVGLATTVITIGGANLLFDGSVNTAVSQFGDVADDDLTWPRITV